MAVKCCLIPLPLLYVYMRIVMSNTYCVVFLLCFSSSCVPYVASFSRLSILIVPSVFSNVYFIFCWTCYHLLSSCICMRYSPLDVKQSTFDHIGQTRSIKGEIFSKKGQSLSFFIINILFISVSIQAFHVNRCLVLDLYVWFQSSVILLLPLFVLYLQQVMGIPIIICSLIFII